MLEMNKENELRSKQMVENLFHLIKENTCSSFVIGIEMEGERYFVKSDHAATLIGYLYRVALKQEQPQSLPGRFLPFTDIDHFVKLD